MENIELNLNFDSELKRFEKSINAQITKTAKAISNKFKSYRSDKFLVLNHNGLTVEDIKSEMALALWSAIEDFKALYNDKNTLGANKFRFYCGVVHTRLNNKRVSLIRENYLEKNGKDIVFLDSEQSNNLFYGEIISEDN